MRKFSKQLGIFTVLTVLIVGHLGFGSGQAHAGGKDKKGFGILEEPGGPGSFLPHHYDNRAGQSRERSRFRRQRRSHIQGKYQRHR